MKHRVHIEIEKGIPIPAINRHDGRSAEADALLSMEVGDSFVMRDSKKIYSSAKWFGVKVKVRRFWNAAERCWEYRVWKMGTKETHGQDARATTL